MDIEHVSATERALVENSERYRSLFAYNPHAAFSLDLEGRFIDTNAVAVQLSGYTQAELRSMHFVDVVCEEEISRVACGLRGGREPACRSSSRRAWCTRKVA